jgi:hypothetical protein
MSNINRAKDKSLNTPIKERKALYYGTLNCSIEEYAEVVAEKNGVKLTPNKEEANDKDIIFVDDYVKWIYKDESFKFIPCKDGIEVWRVRGKKSKINHYPFRGVKQVYTP